MLDGDGGLAGHLVPGDQGGVAAVQLQHVEIHPVEQRHVGMVGAEIAHRQHDAQFLVQEVQVFAAFLVDVLQLAQFKLQLFGGQPCGLQAVFDLIHKIGALGEPGQQVEGKGHVAAGAVADLHGLAGGFPQEGDGEEHGQGVVSFDDLQDGPGGQQRAVRFAEIRNKHFVSVAGIFAEGPFRLSLQDHGIFQDHVGYHALFHICLLDRSAGMKRRTDMLFCCCCFYSTDNQKILPGRRPFS